MSLRWPQRSCVCNCGLWVLARRACSCIWAEPISAPSALSQVNGKSAQCRRTASCKGRLVVNRFTSTQGALWLNTRWVLAGHGFIGDSWDSCRAGRHAARAASWARPACQWVWGAGRERLPARARGRCGIVAGIEMAGASLTMGGCDQLMQYPALARDLAGMAAGAQSGQLPLQGAHAFQARPGPGQLCVYQTVDVAAVGARLCDEVQQSLHVGQRNVQRPAMADERQAFEMRLGI